MSLTCFGLRPKSLIWCKNNCGHAPKNCPLTSSQITKFNLNLPLNFHIFKKKILAIATNKTRWVKNWRPPFCKPWVEMTEPINHDDLRPESRGTSYIMLEKNLKWPSDGPLLMWIIDRLSGLLPPIWTWTLIFGCCYSMQKITLAQNVFSCLA